MRGLARLLSRCAALQGQAAPVSRFEFQTIDDAGSLKTDDLILRLWLNVFPQGSVARLLKIPNNNQLPALWITEQEDGVEKVMLIRGVTASKAIAETQEGAIQDVTLSNLRSGLLIHLKTPEANTNENSSNYKPETAGDWFFYAIIKRRRIFIEAALATILVGLVGLGASLYSMQVYDRVVPTKGYATLVVLTVGALIAVLMELLIKEIRVAMIERACKAIDQELSDVFFAKSMSIRLDARPRTVGTFASQIRQFESVRNFMTSTTLMVLADIPLAIVFIVMIGLIAGWVAVVPLIFIPLALFTGYMFKGPIKKLTEGQNEQSNQKNGLLIEAIDGAEGLKAAGAEWKMRYQWNHLTQQLADKELRIRLLTNLASQLTQTVHQSCYVAMVAFGAYQVVEGHLTMGGMIACSIISSRALQPIAQLPSIITQLQSAMISLASLNGIMKLPDDRLPSQRLVIPDQCQGKLRVENIKFGYEPKRLVLQVQQLNIQPGERIAVLGAVGSGKSTLIKLLSGLYKPAEGKTFLDEVDMFLLAPDFVREYIAYLPQDVRLFNGTLRDNLTIGLPNPPDSVILEAAHACGLANTITRHPQGLDMQIQEGGRGLSGGQRQLVGLARMLIARPKVLLLDEPTASMDTQIEAFVLQHVFEGLAKETSVIMATHKAGTLRYVDRVLVMNQGVIVLDGPRDEVIMKLRGAASADQTGLGE